MKLIEQLVVFHHGQQVHTPAEIRSAVGIKITEVIPAWESIVVVVEIVKRKSNILQLTFDSRTAPSDFSSPLILQPLKPVSIQNLPAISRNQCWQVSKQRCPHQGSLRRHRPTLPKAAPSTEFPCRKWICGIKEHAPGAVHGTARSARLRPP